MEGGSLNLTCQAVSGVRQHRQLNLAQFNSLTSKLVLKAAILLGGGDTVESWLLPSFV